MKMKTQEKSKKSMPKVHSYSRFTDHDIYLFREGCHFELYDKFGSHLVEVNGVKGTYFAVWAPNAVTVSVIGDFNYWKGGSHALSPRWDGSGIWEGFFPGIGSGSLYKYHIVSTKDNLILEKGDPFAFRWETPPRTASMVWDLAYQRKEGSWKIKRQKNNALDAPMSVYEVHFSSWRRKPEEGARPLSYLEMANELPEYVDEMGFTHVEFLPLMEHPFCGSWGYQKVGYFAPSSRYGTPQEFMDLIEALHKKGIGVILDWVPSHFPSDAHGLAYFDGTHLYEHEDPKQGFHPDWKSYIFNYGRHEVRSFLISSALFWFDRYNIDGLRVDGVASMLYLDYSRKEGEWIPNRFGGKENIEAVDFLRTLNTAVYSRFPHGQMVAEESTAWPGVTRRADSGGLGFGLKWNMGWMHDTLNYFSKDPIHRKFHHHELTFSLLYAFSENFLLSLSHDEAVHGKGSLLAKMPGDDWQKFANLRLLYGYLFSHPGKKLLFMGGEFAQWAEWNHNQSLDWHLLENASHAGMQRWVRDLNRVYRNYPSLHQADFSWDGFEWIDLHDGENSTLSYLRKGEKDSMLIICNFTPVPRLHYNLGVPQGGLWSEVLNSDSVDYGGSGIGNFGQAKAQAIPAHGRKYSIEVTLPPLAVLFLRPVKS